MIKIGLTGSIAMGKSTAAALFKKHGIPVFDADEHVARLFLSEDTHKSIMKAFPSTVKEGRVDKNALRKKAFSSHESLDKLERLLHPMVKKAREIFYQQKAAEGHEIVVADIPLLFETGADKEVDFTLVMTAPGWVQKKRIFQRPGMTQDFWDFLQSRQMPDKEKRKKADFVISSAFGKKVTEFYLRRLIRHIKKASV